MLRVKLCLHWTTQEAKRKENKLFSNLLCIWTLSHIISDHPDYAETLQHPILDALLQSGRRKKAISPQEPREV